MLSQVSQLLFENEKKQFYNPKLLCLSKIVTHVDTSFWHIRTIQIIRDTFLAYFRPPPSPCVIW